MFVPFGTALAIYTCWVLLNDDARQQFGRAPRGAGDRRIAGARMSAEPKRLRRQTSAWTRTWPARSRT